MSATTEFRVSRNNSTGCVYFFAWMIVVIVRQETITGLGNRTLCRSMIQSYTCQPCVTSCLFGIDTEASQHRDYIRVEGLLQHTDRLPCCQHVHLHASHQDKPNDLDRPCLQAIERLQRQ